MNYRIANIQDALEDVLRGLRTPAKEGRRRRLKWDLVKLEHEELSVGLRIARQGGREKRESGYGTGTRGTNDVDSLQGTSGIMCVNGSASVIESGRTEMRTKITIVKGEVVQG